MKEYDDYEKEDDGLGVGTMAGLLAAGALATPVGKPVRKLIGKAVNKVSPNTANKARDAMNKVANAKMLNPLKGGALSRAEAAGVEAAGPTSDRFKDTLQNIAATGRGTWAAGRSLAGDARRGLSGAVPEAPLVTNTPDVAEAIRRYEVVSNQSYGDTASIFAKSTPALPSNIIPPNAVKAATTKPVYEHSGLFPDDTLAFSGSKADRRIIDNKPELQRISKDDSARLKKKKERNNTILRRQGNAAEYAIPRAHQKLTPEQLDLIGGATNLGNKEVVASDIEALAKQHKMIPNEKNMFSQFLFSMNHAAKEDWEVVNPTEGLTMLINILKEPTRYD